MGAPAGVTCQPITQTRYQGSDDGQSRYGGPGAPSQPMFPRPDATTFLALLAGAVGAEVLEDAPATHALCLLFGERIAGRVNHQALCALEAKGTIARLALGL